ncbi:glycosyltransferase family 4 protein [Spirosoma sp. BT702]|uniref:Glycosyltransferase family 4 protein n=1 Tax=Spirosoma profusum TaxID=2771354 RepID=A0A927AUS3_9BACT|nr:glycosyltransferase family 4 protein [Spirosoma profusum]MBD2704793.1 glycosyltransferase family 4 protein [Spirosoma profusum]
MKILYLTFYFEPDIGPGPFRNTALVHELARQLSPNDSIHVITTFPNRYDSYKPGAFDQEIRQDRGCPITIKRIRISNHKSGFLDQIRSFYGYFRSVHQLTYQQPYDLVVASSSRLFTAFLAAILSKRGQIPLFLDIRDVFREAILGVIKNPLIRLPLNPLLRLVERYTFNSASHINLVSEGFRSYFRAFSKATYSYYPNAIDDMFLALPASRSESAEIYRPKTLLYAGNIGDGQGLHTIIPQAARQLGTAYQFVIIGDGGARQKLEEAIRKERLTNVHIRQPTSRQLLLDEYQKADYLFVHLNNLETCKRVLPSKLFEYGATDKPILAGVTGYAASFMNQHIPNSLLFKPGDVASLVCQLRNTPYRTEFRPEFIRRFQRRTICEAMAQLIRVTLENAQKT